MKKKLLMLAGLVLLTSFGFAGEKSKGGKKGKHHKGGDCSELVEKLKEKGLTDDEIKAKLEKRGTSHKKARGHKSDRRGKGGEFQKLSPEEREAKVREHLTKKGLSDAEIDEKINKFKEKRAERAQKGSK